MKLLLSLLCCFVFAPAIESPASDAIDIVAINNKGQWLKNAGKHAESFAEFKEALKHHPTGDRPVRYSFVVLGKKGARSRYRITLGSYPTSTEKAPIGDDIGSDEVVFHLDGDHRSEKHETDPFFTGEPGYDETRKMVIGILEGKRKAV